MGSPIGDPAIWHRNARRLPFTTHRALERTGCPVFFGTYTHKYTDSRISWSTPLRADTTRRSVGEFAAHPALLLYFCKIDSGPGLPPCFAMGDGAMEQSQSASAHDQDSNPMSGRHRARVGPCPGLERGPRHASSGSPSCGNPRMAHGAARGGFPPWGPGLPPRRGHPAVPGRPGAPWPR